MDGTECIGMDFTPWTVITRGGGETGKVPSFFSKRLTLDDIWCLSMYCED